MDRVDAYVKGTHLVYPCPTCRRRHYHGYSAAEPKPYRRVTHCPLESGDVLIHLKQKSSYKVDEPAEPKGEEPPGRTQVQAEAGSARVSPPSHQATDGERA